MTRVDRGLLVPVVRGSNQNGVDIFARQDLAVVAGGEEVLAPELPAVLEAPVTGAAEIAGEG